MANEKPGSQAAFIVESKTDEGVVLSRTTHEVFGFATQLDADEFLQGSVDALQEMLRGLGQLKAGK